MELEGCVEEKRKTGIVYIGDEDEWDSEVETMYEHDEFEFDDFFEIVCDDETMEPVVSNHNGPTWVSADCKWVVPDPDSPAMSSDVVRWNNNRRLDYIGSVGSGQAGTEEDCLPEE